MSDLSLYWTTSDFTIDGIQYTRLPLFFRSETMRIEYLPTEYCIHLVVVRGRSRSWKTWKRIGLTLRAFLVFMEQHAFNWKDPTEEYLAHFRTHLERKQLTRTTIARSMNAVCNFYEWATLKGHIAALPFTREVVTVLNRGARSHVSRARMSGRSVLVPTVPTRRRYPRYYTREEQERIFQALSERDRLIMEWALYTGAREFEISELTLDDLPPPEAYRSRKAFAVTITGKGGVVADLHVPAWLLDRTFQYVRFFDRARVERAARRRGHAPSRSIFLSRWGNCLKPNSIYKTFSAKLKELRLRGTFHDLRHTYAISTLDKLMKLARHQGTDGMNAVLDLKHLMRHAAITSTETYLWAWQHYIDEVNSDLFDLPERYISAS